MIPIMHPSRDILWLNPAHIISVRTSDTDGAIVTLMGGEHGTTVLRTSTASTDIVAAVSALLA